MENSIISIAKSYLQIPTAPFREEYIREFVKSFCNERKISHSQDPYGNITVSCGKQVKNNNKTKLAFIAHMDHPGFIVEKNSRDTSCTALFYGG
jgi:putative aminopeptidase FrvX